MTDLWADVMFAAEAKGAKGLEKLIPDLNHALTKGDIETVALCFDEIVTLGDSKMVALLLDMPWWSTSAAAAAKRLEFIRAGIETADLHGKTKVADFLRAALPVPPQTKTAGFKPPSF